MEAGADAPRKEHRPRQAGAKVNKAKAALLKKDPSRKNTKNFKARAAQPARLSPEHFIFPSRPS